MTYLAAIHFGGWLLCFLFGALHPVRKGTLNLRPRRVCQTFESKGVTDGSAVT